MKALFVKATLVLIVFIYSGLVSAVSLSTYRIYLDRQQRDYNFSVSNRDEVEQTCKLSLTHHNIDKNGVPKLVMGDKLPENSAVELLRYSPRNFIIPPLGEQTVRFRMRSKKGIAAKEYRSYLAVNCAKIIKATTNQQDDETVGTNKAKISYSPRLVHQVPIIVRPLKLQTQVDITEISINEENSEVSFNVLRQGERSIFADVELIEKSSNKRIDLVKNVKIYPENNIKRYTVQTQGIPADNLVIRLTEDKRAGGDLVLNKNVTSAQEQ